MTRTGIFFHYQQGERLADFPQILEGILEKPHVVFYDAHYPQKPKASQELEVVPQELLLDVHSEAMLKQVRNTPYYESALYSAGGTVQAGEKIWEGEIDNAFVFTGVGDHHAGRGFFGGWCYLNGAALAIANLRRKYDVKRFAIIDTDAHHGNGTWSLFEDDEKVFYLCLCNEGFVERKNKVNITVGYHSSDDEYMDKVKKEFVPRCERFSPELIFWNWGYDGTRGEYGDMGLTPDCHPAIAKILKATADKVCDGRIIVVLCGGQGRHVASYAIPRIIRCLAEV